MLPLLNMAQANVKFLENTVLGLLSRINNVDSIHEVSFGKDADHQE